MCLFLRVNLGSYWCEFFIFPRRAGWVNPCAKGLVRLDGSVALSQLKVRGHIATFKGSGPFYFLLLYQAAMPTGCKTPPWALKNPGTTWIPAISDCLKFTLNILKADKLRKCLVTHICNVSWCWQIIKTRRDGCGHTLLKSSTWLEWHRKWHISVCVPATSVLYI